MNRPVHRLWWLWWTIIFCLLFATSAPAASLLDRVKNQEISQIIHLKVGHSKVLRTPFTLTRISVANPHIADIILISDREIYINGLAPGMTNVSLWGKSRFTSASVMVEADLTLLKEKLHQILPKEKIGVETAGNSIVLSGEVSGPVAQSTALEIARAFIGAQSGGGKKSKGTKIVNLMHIGGVQQVMLAVRVAEINRTLAEQIGIDFAAVAPNSFGVNTLNNLAPVSNFVHSADQATSLTQSLTSNITAFWGFKAAGTLWTMFLNLMKEKGLGRVLAEPNLVTTSGQKASFLAGGEYPIPVPQSGIGGAGTITIEYKKYGVQLDFTPTILNNDKIAIRVHPIVSQLDYSNALTLNTYVVPALLTREMNTHVEVRDGQTFAIAGLLQDQTRDLIRKFPLLGDLPVLGTLFRSTQYQKNETELVALVTPHLVKSLTPTQAKLPTDNWIDPTDVDVYLLGRQQGQAKSAPRPMPQAPLPAGFGNQSVN